MNLRPLHHGEHGGHGAGKRFLILLLSVFSALSVVPVTRAAEPFLKKGDVIALVGGEDMVVAGELGYLELLLTRALPDYRLRFRNLAWEGDTVFEQRRDLNFPPLEAQLDQVGATVVICQFGQMEALAAAQRKGTTENTESTEKEEAKDPRIPASSSAPSAPSVVKKPAAAADPAVQEPIAAGSTGITAENTEYADNAEENKKQAGPSSAPSVSSADSAVKNAAAADPALQEFIAAYEKLIARMSAGGKRRILILAPTPVEPLWLPSGKFISTEMYGIPATVQLLNNPSYPHPRPAYAREREAAEVAAYATAVRELAGKRALPFGEMKRDSLSGDIAATRDGFHLSQFGQHLLEKAVSPFIPPRPQLTPVPSTNIPAGWFTDGEALRQQIIAKNRLWFDYWRVQNWAFLAGDRTNQPSSRDHRDPTRRWFPAEREEFLPLIAAKEREIDALAAQLAGK